MADTRIRLLQAAEKVIRREGVGALTLDAVAAEAGVSKGGLLYHFPSKRDLIDAMIRSRGVEFTESVERQLAAGTSSGAAEAYVLACAEMPATRLDTAILAGVVEDPALADTYRDSMEDLMRRVTGSGDQVLASVVRLACDGLWLGEMLGIEPAGPASSPELIERLRELAREANRG